MAGGAIARIGASALELWKAGLTVSISIYELANKKSVQPSTSERGVLRFQMLYQRESVAF